MLCHLLRLDVPNPLVSSWALKTPGHLLGSQPNPYKQHVGMENRRGETVLEGKHCHLAWVTPGTSCWAVRYWPAGSLQFFTVPVASATVSSIMRCVSIHLYVFSTRVHVFPRQEGRPKLGSLRCLTAPQNIIHRPFLQTSVTQPLLKPRCTKTRRLTGWQPQCNVAC